MAQIRESQFGIIAIDEEDMDLVDLAGGGVIVETEHEYYTHELEESIAELDEGDIIYAMVQGEDVLQPNSIWRFLKLNVIGHDPSIIRQT